LLRVLHKTLEGLCCIIAHDNIFFHNFLLY
jgi:hypothetical protein